MSQGFDPNYPANSSTFDSAEERIQHTALASNHLGSTPPAITVEGMKWIDTTTANDWKLKYFLNNNWVTVAEGFTGVDSGSNPVNPKSTLTNSQGFIHTQATASNSWVVPHSLLKQFPNVIVVDAANVTQAFTNISFTDAESLTINFPGAVTGKAIVS